MFKRYLSAGLIAAALVAPSLALPPVQAYAQGGFGGEPIPTAGQDELDSTLPINTHTGGYQGGFGGGPWHSNAWQSGDVGGTWHDDGWHAGGVNAGGFNGPSTVNNFYSNGCTMCSSAPQSAASLDMPPPDTGYRTVQPPSGCQPGDGGQQVCGDSILQPYYGNNSVYYQYHYSPGK